MSQRVVHGFELVQVEIKQRENFGGARGALRQFLDFFLKTTAIGQPRQRIVKGQSFQRSFVLFFRRDVTQRNDSAIERVVNADEVDGMNRKMTRSAVAILRKLVGDFTMRVSEMFIALRIMLQKPITCQKPSAQ